ncbi:MAG: methyltransferase domain-containing protein [Opitutaceae bacterium]|nr:methyltransferase domain-containing protein [Opitutaceae bacterium]
MARLDHRYLGYQLLQGYGLEIGALHEPAPIPPGVEVEYFDAISEIEAASLFPEIDCSRFVRVKYVGDLDSAGLKQIPSQSRDFVIANHVLEHLSNPIRAVEEMFRILKTGGIAVIAIPDKRFTFDSKRLETSFEHLWQDYQSQTVVSDDSHYLDFLESAAPHVFMQDPTNLSHHVARARARREHTHVWTSETFRSFLYEAMKRLGIDAHARYEICGDETRIEYFSAWQKRSSPSK